jgi:hypothetical protein
MMARDYFAIQAAGVGIEREFNIARMFNQDNRTYGAQIMASLMICNHRQAEANLVLKQEFYVRSRVEDMTPEELEAELEADEEATAAVIRGLHIIAISDDEEDDEEDDEDDRLSDLSAYDRRIAERTAAEEAEEAAASRRITTRAKPTAALTAEKSSKTTTKKAQARSSRYMRKK